VAISKLFFFPSWKCGDLGFFLEIFQTARFTMYVFIGGLFNGFSSQKKIFKNKKLAALRLCVCFSWFKETGGLHSA
jgi:hypothetical protein